MIFLEMSRDEVHGGGSWAFSRCVWAPTEKEGGGRWTFWSKILDVRNGDTILHLKGTPPNAAFIGYSIAASDGYETSQRPPIPGVWAHSFTFFRADLKEFTLFDNAIKLTEVFETRRSELNNFFDMNRARAHSKINIFYVRQSSRLQCLNGAYFSEIDDELFSALFEVTPTQGGFREVSAPVTLATGQQLTLVKARLGQATFSRTLKRLHKNTCCFPTCPVSDERFLVASHIARWSDSEKLRGHLGNGLCFCLMHDKAFEIGLFTLDTKFCVFINPNSYSSDTSVITQLRLAHGKQIRISAIAPLSEALAEHWARVKLYPD